MSVALPHALRRIRRSPVESAEIALNVREMLVMTMLLPTANQHGTRSHVQCLLQHDMLLPRVH